MINICKNLKLPLLTWHCRVQYKMGQKFIHVQKNRSCSCGGPVRKKKTTKMSTLHFTRWNAEQQVNINSSELLSFSFHYGVDVSYFQFSLSLLYCLQLKRKFQKRFEHICVTMKNEVKNLSRLPWIWISLLKAVVPVTDPFTYSQSNGTSVF